MKYLDFSNVEELIFEDQALQRKLPVSLFNYFEQWRLSKRVPYLRDIGKQAMLDLLNALEDEHVSVLEDYFGEKIVVEKLNYSTVSCVKVPLDEIKACERLCAVEGFTYFNTWRDDEYLYVTFWR